MSIQYFQTQKFLMMISYYTASILKTNNSKPLKS